MTLLRFWLHRIGARVKGRQPLDSEAFTERLLYPDITNGGLSSFLQQELDKRAPHLKATWPEGSRYWSKVEIDGGERSALAYCAVEERSFGLELWADSIEHLSGWTSGPAELPEAICQWLTPKAPGTAAMAGRFPFLETNPFAEAFERGEAIEFLWSQLLESPPVESLRPLIEAAAQEPLLRQLRPYTSLDQFHFSRWVTYPFSFDLPYAVPEMGRFRVFRPNVMRHLSGSHVEFGVGGADRAVKLLLAALPEPLEVTYRGPAS